MKKRDKQKSIPLQKPSLYGFHAVKEAFLNTERHVSALYLTENAVSGFESVLKEARSNGLERPNPHVMDKQTLEKILPKDAVHQGIALACSALPEMDAFELMIKKRDQARVAFVILDQVTDPHNVGAIMRSASAFGLDGVIMQTKHAPMLDGVLAKTACGAIEHIDVGYAVNLSRAIEDFQAEGYFVIGLDEHASESVGKLSDFQKLVLVLGSEGDGMRRLIREKCDSILCLPTTGKIASLNVSNAAAVSFYAIQKTK
ncbi:MAG: 23S rRNA (guanosine(2251)-2'-O)-methyltransferase RlmB [Alphaproteobacteria bacterium]|nr:23S rRNA (guanosine(2251)-2'-O)-methyltransferase RlmB [Alphaproteobacteria bacterium]